MGMVRLRVKGYPTLVTMVTLLGIGISITRPYLSLFGTEVIHMAPATLGLFLFVNSLGSVVASTWIGRLSDTKLPKKSIILVTSLCAAGGYLSFVIFHTYGMLLVVSTLALGLGASTFPQIFAYARESIVAEAAGEATFAIAMLRSFFSLAWVVGPLVGAWILATSGFTSLFVTTACVYGFVWILALLRLRRRPAPHAHIGRVTSVFAPLRRREVWASTLALVAIYTASNMNGQYMPLFVTRELHAPDRIVGWIVSVSALLEIPIMLFLGRIAERVGKRQLLVAGAVGGIGYYALAAVAHAAWEMIALQVLCATLISITVGIGMSYFQDFMPDAPGTATTLFSNTNSVGTMVGSLLGGAVAQAFGFRAVYWVCAMLGLSAVALLHVSRAKHSAVAAPTQNAPG